MSKKELLDSILPQVYEEFNRLAEHLNQMGQRASVEEIEVSYRRC